MGRILSILIGAIAMLAASTGPGQAITGDYVADDEHPFVGLVAFYDEAGEFTGRCSGSLLTPASS